MRQSIIRPLNPFPEVGESFDLVGDKEIVSYLSEFTKSIDNRNIAIVKTSTNFNIDSLRLEDANIAGLSVIVNLKRVNDMPQINSFFGAVNQKLKTGGLFVGCVETYVLRKERILKKFPAGFNRLYYFFDYLGKRVAPKVPLLKNIYHFVTAGRNRVLSKTECLGRLYYNGFEIISTRQIGKQLYFVAKKVKELELRKAPLYGPIFKMKRLGLAGKTIYVYKFRTMHPFSEYLQEYIYRLNKLAEGGKFKDDFRVTTLGKILRRTFLDELPMIWNWFKGEIKLVGVRPLSEQYLSLYDRDLQQQRLKFKPGLVPPYYADLPKDLAGIMASERKYFDAYSTAPFKTDFVYFFRAFKNILIKKILGV
ncbi:MAG: sugar transferase [Flavobacteriales bacterium]|nr:sugar transferase [Flavobacteriales bacterium]